MKNECDDCNEMLLVFWCFLFSQPCSSDTNILKGRNLKTNSDWVKFSGRPIILFDLACILTCDLTNKEASTPLWRKSFPLTSRSLWARAPRRYAGGESCPPAGGRGESWGEERTAWAQTLCCLGRTPAPPAARPATGLPPSSLSSEKNEKFLNVILNINPSLLFVVYVEYISLYSYFGCSYF